MRIGLYFVLGFLCLPKFSLAQEQEESAEQQMETVKKEEPKKPKGVSGESEAARYEKMAGVELGYGLMVGSISGMQFHGYYNLKPNLSVGLLYNSGSFDFSSLVSDTAEVAINKADVSATLILAHARYFVGNSFFLNFGLGQRQIAFDFDLSSTEIDYGIRNEITASSTVVMIGLGNQWQWDSGFSLGVEWLGYAVPLSAESSDSLESYGSVASQADASVGAVDSLSDDSEDLAKTLGELSTPRLFMISLGWAF